MTDRPAPRLALAEARLAAGFSQQQLATHLEVSIGAIRGWESGQRTPVPRNRQPLADALGISTNRLHQLLSPDAPVELNGHRLPPWLNLYDSLVLAAGQLDQVEKAQVPALLQTRAYALSIERYGPRDLTRAQLNERVEARLARQDVLKREPDPLRLVVLMAESALREMIGEATIMLAQYDHLLQQAALPNVELRIIPATGKGACALGNFQLLTKPGDNEPFVAASFCVTGPNYDDLPEVMQIYIDHYRYLFRSAWSPTESVRHIEEMREYLKK